MSAEVLLLILAGFVLYPMFVGVSYRFLGRKDRLGLVWKAGTQRWCFKHNHAVVNESQYCGGCGSGHKVKTRRYDSCIAWTCSATWPLTWAFIFIAYLAYYAIWTPIKLLALATAKTAQLTSGEKNGN